jgi:predicted secreted protein
MTTGAVTGLNMTLSVGGDILGGQRSVSVNFAQATIDVTSRDSSRKGEYLAGRRDVTIDFDALYIYTDIAKKVLVNHFTSASPATLTCIVTMPDGITYTGTGNLTSFTLNGPFEDALTASGSIQITDGITASAS